MAEIELTEMHDIEVTRQDGVENPANGWPVLIMKAVNAKGGIDEKPDIAGATSVLQGIARLIIAEAQEFLATGDECELWDIQNLCEAACLMACFRENEQYGDDDDGSMLKSAGLVCKAHRKFSSDERKKLASEGNALPDGSYPIPDEDALHRAAILAKSGHGDVAAAKRLIAKRAKELGVANPLADTDNTKKDTGCPGDCCENCGSAPAEPAVQKDDDTETSAPADGQDADGETSTEVLADQIEKAVAKATQAAEERVEALAAELAKMRATPIPGGPMLTSTAVQHDAVEQSALLAKAAKHERLADIVGDRSLAKFHREEAAAARAAANK